MHDIIGESLPCQRTIAALPHHRHRGWACPGQGHVRLRRLQVAAPDFLVWFRYGGSGRHACRIRVTPARRWG